MSVVVAATIATACSSVDEPAIAPDRDPQRATAGFLLSVSGVQSGERASRAPGALGDAYDRGEGYENYIDVYSSDFCFLFFSDDNLFIGKLDVTSVLPVEDFNSSKTYSVVGDLSQAIVDAGSVRIMALANWHHNYPDLTDLAGKSLDDVLNDIASSRYSFDPSMSLPSESNTIPLYGITNLMTLDYDAINCAHIGTIHLLRAFAKIEVLNSASSIDDISSVTLTRYNTAGYRAPRGIRSKDDYVHGNYDLDYTDANIPAGVTEGVNLPFERSASNPRNSFIVYVPEFINAGKDSLDRARIHINFSKDHAEIPDVVEFKYYQAPQGQPELEGQPFDILRNYWYRFTVTKRRDLTVEVILVPYAESVLNPDFGIEPPVDDDNIKFYEPVLNERFDDILFYRNERNEKCLTPDLRPLPYDPEKTLDPVTDWWKVICEIERFDGTKREILYYYYDPVNKLQYAPDRKTPVRVVFSWSEPGFVSYLVLEKNAAGEYDFTPQAYYHDSFLGLWYDLAPKKYNHVDTEGYIVDMSSHRYTTQRGTPIAFQGIDADHGYAVDASGNRLKYYDGDSKKEVEILMKGMLKTTPFPAP